jgi:hypothetical protein
MRLKPIDFSDLPIVLTKCARIAVDEIISVVYKGTMPNGMQQKQNKPSTIRRKGHDHPLIESTGRFMDKKTYNIHQIGNDAVQISMIPDAAKIAGYLEKKGYIFFDMTEQAEQRIGSILDRYIIQKVKEAFRG